jgi:transcription initiation factor IIE alpha subunit
MSIQQQNQTFLGTKHNLDARANNPRIKMLKNLVKILYDDISYEIINYIINLNNLKAEEQTLAEKLNLNYTQVRQSLIQMGKHGLLISSEFKRKRNEEEEEKYQIMQRQNKYKTSEWELNDKFYKIVKDRFGDLNKKLETKLKDRETLKFICPKCQNIYLLSKAAHLEYQCSQCIEKPKLIEHKAE